MGKSVTHKGITAMQSDYNQHVALVKDNHIVARFSCNQKKSGKELRDMIDYYLLDTNE